MLVRFVLSALQYRKKRLILAFAAMAVAATLATALFSIYAGIEKKLRGEFRGYGANLMIAPAPPAKTVPLHAVTEAAEDGAQASPVLFTVGSIKQESIVVAGMDFERSEPFTRYWRVQGARRAGLGECLAGAAGVSHFGWKLGSRAALDGAPCVLRGIVITGGPEENQLMLPLAAVEGLAGTQNAASVIQVRADGNRLEAVRSRLQKALPGTDVRIVRAVAETEGNVVLKVRTALLLLTLLILSITTLCVTSNFSELVIERTKEIGILKALGAAEEKISAIFLSESAILALGAAITGYVAGLFVAGGVGQSVFETGFELRPDAVVFLMVGAVTLLVALLATTVAIRAVWRIQPAIILRGE